MVRVRVSAAVAAVGLVGVLAGCGGGGPSEDCTTLTDAELESMAAGLNYTGAEVTKGAWVPIPDEDQELGYTRLAAVQVDQESEGTSDVATLATNDDETLIMALDNMARLYFNWGSATTDDSPAGQWRDGLYVSETADTAKGCLG